MTVENTPMEGLKVIISDIYKDNRGYFTESYNAEKWKEHEIDCLFIQDNQSKSEFGTIRGLHFQTEPYAQAKLVRVLAGRILDVAVDLRRSSPTFGHSFALELSDENFKQLLVPRGFAHGFSVLSETATVLYKVDNIYSPKHEQGLIFDDETLKIDWKIPRASIKLSEKDKKNAKFSPKNDYFQ